MTVKEFERGCPENLWELSDQLRSGTFLPQAVRRTHIPQARIEGNPAVGHPDGIGIMHSLQ